MKIPVEPDAGGQWKVKITVFDTNTSGAQPNTQDILIHQVILVRTFHVQLAHLYMRFATEQFLIIIAQKMEKLCQVMAISRFCHPDHINSTMHI